MITIVITGPSGSGKSHLTNKLLELFDDSIVLKTDSYYRDNILIRIISKFKLDLYDRLISIKKNELKETLRSIYNKESLISFSNYDFIRKKSSNNKIRVNYKNENQFLILEGIFSHRLDLSYQETINIICESKKEICLKRRLIRDKIERDRNSREVNNKFNKSWYLFYKSIKGYQKTNKVISLNPSDKISYYKLITDLKEKKKKNN